MGFAKSTPIGKNIRPGFVGDFLSREHVLAGGVKLDASTFPGEDAVRVKLTANAAAAATTLAVEALSGDIEDNTLLDFGTNKFARVNDLPVTGDTQITTDAIPTALVAGDTAYFHPVGTGKRVAAGTPVFLDETAFEGAAATGIKWKYAGGGVAVGNNDRVCILAYDVQDVDDLNDGDLLRKGTLVYVNFMYWDELHPTVQAKIRADYEVSVGTPGQEVPAT
jgi:hypothetical protein